jgi:lysophospholipase L1-like esterase
MRRFQTRSAKAWLAVAATLAALAIALPVALFFKQRTKKPRSSPYGLQLVDDAGRALGKPHGPLKLAFDPFCVYRLAPNQHTRRVTVNSLGGRGSEGDPKLPAVAFLGGSASFGQELASDAEVFTSMLNARSSGFRWLNFGCPGYLSGQESSFFMHRLREVAPAVVVSVGGWNDCFGAVQGQPRRIGFDGFNEMFFEIRNRLADFHAGGDGKGESLPPPEVTRDEAFERAAKIYLANMLDLHRLASARGATFLWVIQPELGAKPNRSRHENDILAAWEKHYRYSPVEFTRRYAELRRRAKEHAREHGIPFLDVNDSEAWTSANELLFADPVHPNAAGHRVMGEVLAAAVDKLDRTRSAKTAN